MTSLVHSQLSYIQAGEKGTGAVSSDEGTLNRCARQLLENDQQLMGIANTLAAQIQDMLAQQQSTILGTAYPVGAFYISGLNTNPQTLFGFGTWVRKGQGRVLMGEGATTDINGESRTYQMSASVPAVAKKIRFTVVGSAASGDYIVIAGEKIYVSGSPTEIAQYLAAYPMSGSGVVVRCENPSGAIVDIVLSPEAGDGSVVVTNSGFTISSLSTSVAYVAPVFGQTGGEFRHKLTVPELPAHHHQQEYGGTQNSIGAAGTTSPKNSKVSIDSQTGADLYHNNVQPYILCYIWQRTE